MSLPDPIDALEQRLGYRFRNRSLLVQALTHVSCAAEGTGGLETNQRLEFLGDAVLELVLSEQLFAALPTAREGELSRRRAALTKGAVLAQLARDLRIGETLHVSPAEAAAGGRTRDAALEDALEALIGAIYCDADWATVRGVVRAWYGDLGPRLTGLDTPQENPKGQLQERVHPEHGTQALRYEVAGTTGPDHDRRYEVVVRLAGTEIGRGSGPSKKSAEEEAARDALQRPTLSVLLGPAQFKRNA
ncbi:MAG: ribonuclease III [Verrucomicrobia bacterium]|nr:ribonuclease III [Verrucomicrobiota bacterium]